MNPSQYNYRYCIIYYRFLHYYTPHSILYDVYFILGALALLSERSLGNMSQKAEVCVLPDRKWKPVGNRQTVCMNLLKTLARHMPCGPFCTRCILPRATSLLALSSIDHHRPLPNWFRLSFFRPLFVL